VGGMSLSHYRQLTSVSSNYPLLNRATQGLYTPGSTFKVNTATAALDDHLYLPTYGTTLTPSTLINDPGSFTIPNCSAGAGCVFQDDDSSGCGSCNLVTAIAMSDDVFFYTLGYWFYAQPRAYGIDPIQRIAADYGVGQPTGIDLPGAYTGQVDGPRLRQRQHREAPKAYPYTYYGPGDAINTAFGQGETVLTPLQLANEYATFANGGTRYAPEVAAAVVSPDGKVIRRVRPRVMAHVPLPPSTRQPMLQGFTEEVTDPIGTAFGTAQLTNYPYAKLPIAGKTGTSQVSANANTQPDSLYVAFGPVAHPRYVIATIIPNAGYGATASAPVVFRLFEYLIRHPVGPLDLKPPAAAG
jgi:penicillin-binding protein 2